MKEFDGRKIRDDILLLLKNKISIMSKKPTLAVVLVGNSPVSEKYVQLKQKFAKKIGVNFVLIKFDRKTTQKIITNKILALNDDNSIDGIMIQIPLPEHINRDEVILTVDRNKDVDGLYTCLGLESSVKSPIVFAVLKAIKMSKKNIKKSNIVIVGCGFLVGKPLYNYFTKISKKVMVVDTNTPNPQNITKKADIIISAVGKPNFIKKNMVKKNVVLIDAGTSEVNGDLLGDIDPKVFDIASYYTPVPGGIGPVTIAMLLQNTVHLSKRKSKQL